MSCDYQSILAATKCFECIPEGAQMGIHTYLLRAISGTNLSADQLMSAARCISTCIPPGMLNEVKTRLLCEVVDNLAPPEPPAPECDADAQAFITAAGITDTVAQGAICVLVRDLKAYPEVGTKYWDRDILIYPFVSNSTDSAAQRATRHAFNLKNPAGANNLTYGGGGLVHTAFGVQGNLAGFAQTNYTITSQDSFRAMWYSDVFGTANASYLFGSVKMPGFAAYFTARKTLVNPKDFNYYSNDATLTAHAASASLGMRMIQRYVATSKRATSGIGVWVQTNINSTGVPNFPIMLFALSVSGVAATPTNERISSFSFGDPLDTGGGNTEHLEYKGIWDAFNNTLGRGHP